MSIRRHIDKDTQKYLEQVRDTRSSCDGKIRHDSASDAQKAAKQMTRAKKRRNKAKIVQLTVYSCKFCAGWHLGGYRGKQ